VESNQPNWNEDWPEDVVDILRLPVARSSDDIDGQPLYPDDKTVTLQKLVETADGQLTFSQVVHLFRAILGAIRRIHRAGFVHLRLSPETITIRPARTDGAAGLSLEETTADATGEADSDNETASDTGKGASVAASDASASDRAAAGTSDQGDGEVGDDSTSPGTGAADQDALEESTQPAGPRDDASRAGDDTQSDPTLQELYPLAEEVVAGIDDESPVETSQFVASPAAASADWLDRVAAEASAQQSDSADIQTKADTDGAMAVMDDIERAVGSLDIGERYDWEVRLLPDGGVVKQEDVPADPPTDRGYSSPEIIAGRANAPEPEVTDLFSLGMVLYFLVTGRRPPASVYSRHAPAIPSRNLRFKFPPGLEPVIKRATRPAAEERFPDLDAFKNAFDEAAERIETRREQREAPRLVAGAERHVGIAKRRRNPVNQDRVFRAVSNDGQFGLIAVADGVSTATFGSGEIASRMFVDAAAEAWDDLLPDYIMEEPADDARAVREILLDANERIVEWVNERHTPFEGSPHEVMGTTALIVLYRRGIVTLASLGDSRAYLQNGPGLEQLTIDHNLWTLSILDGMEADEALSMPQGEALARCLGTFDLEEGELEPREPDYDLLQHSVTEGDTLLLTTDGLVDFAAGTPVAAEENILATLLSEPDPELACLELILLANRGGGGDNIGLGVLRFK